MAEDQTDGPNSNEWDDPEEFVEEQGLMGRVIHLLRAENPGKYARQSRASFKVSKKAQDF